MADWEDYYEILGVSPDSTAGEIKEAYLYKVNILHPDGLMSRPESIRRQAEKDLKKVNRAYEVLKDPQKRQEYHSEWVKQRAKSKETFIPKPKPIVDPPHICFSNVEPGEIKRASFIIRNVGGPYSNFLFSDPDSWVRVVHQAPLTTADELPLEVEIEAEGEEWEKTYSEYIRVKLDEEETQVRIELQTKPEPIREKVAVSGIPTPRPTPKVGYVGGTGPTTQPRRGFPTWRKWMIGLTCIAALIAGGIAIFGEGRERPLEWNKTFGGSGSDWGNSIQQTRDGGYIIAGRTRSYGAGASDVWLIKTDAKGNKEWARTFGGSDSDWGDSVQQTRDGGYVVVGSTGSYGAGEQDAWLIKTDAKGNKEWNKTFGGSDSDWGDSVQQTLDGGYIITGKTDSYGAGASDAWLIKTDAKGNKEWDKTFGGSGDDYGFSVRQTRDGGYIIAGRTGSYGAGDWDVWLIKTDAKGNKEWNKTFGGSDRDDGYSIQQTRDGGYIIVGETSSYGAGERDVWLIKTNAKGNKEWARTFGGSDSDWGDSVQQTRDGGYVVVGSTGSYGAGEQDAWLIKTDAKGNKEWDKTFGGSDSDWGDSVQQTRDGGYIVVGSTGSYGAGGWDVWLIKTDATGEAPLPTR
jgi:hypothetical protein